MRSAYIIHVASCRAAAAGGWRGLYLAYRRTALMPKRRVWVDNGQGGVHVPVSIAEGSKVTMGDAVVCGAQGQQVSSLACHKVLAHELGVAARVSY